MSVPKGPKPQFQDVTLYDQDNGEPFTFTAKEQEFFWRQGFTHVPKHSPERRKMLREQRFAGKDVFNVTCKKCGRVGKILQEPPVPKEILCDRCFDEVWASYLNDHPEVAEVHEKAAQEAEMDRQQREAERMERDAQAYQTAQTEAASYQPY